MISKLYSLRKLKKTILQLKSRRKKIVFTNGCFDILHAGHVEYLDAAKKSGDFLIVGLNSDGSVRRLKGPTRPINRENDRAKILSGLSSVDAVVLFHEDTPLKLITELMPDVLVKGSDWKVSEIAGAKEVLAGGGLIKRIRLLKGRSTSSIIHQVQTRS